MPHRTNGHTDVRFRDALDTLRGSLQRHPLGLAVGAVAIVVVIVGALFTTQWFAHVERSHRQLWIETTFENRIDKNNELLAKVDAKLASIRESQQLTAEFVEGIQTELRGNRVALLELIKRIDAPRN